MNNTENSQDCFLESMIDDIINTSDKEIIKESNQEYTDYKIEVGLIDDIFEKSLISVGKERLKAAKNHLQSEKPDQIKDIELTTDNYRNQLFKFLDENPDLENEMTLAARNGDEQLSENDAKTTLEDLQYLKDDFGLNE